VYPELPAAVLIVKLASVVVSAKVKAMFRASVVVMELPPLYADCRVMDAAEHFTRLFELSKHNVSPVVVCSPDRITVESASVLKVMSLVASGEKVEAPLAVKLCPVATLAPPLKVASPVAVKALLTVEVPPTAPKDNVVAALPIFKVVALVLNREAVVEVVVKSPPLTATSAAAVTFPVRVEVLSTVKVPLAWIFPVLEIATPVFP